MFFGHKILSAAHTGKKGNVYRVYNTDIMASLVWLVKMTALQLTQCYNTPQSPLRYLLIVIILLKNVTQKQTFKFLCRHLSPGFSELTLTVF